MPTDIFINLDLFVVPTNTSVILFALMLSLAAKLCILVIQNVDRNLW